MSGGLLAGLALALLGAVLVLFAPRRSTGPARPDIAEFFDYDDAPEPVDAFQANLSRPFATRVLGELGRGLLRPVVHFFPSHYLAGTQRKLMQAGLSTTRTPVEQVSAQILLSALMLVLGAAYVVTAKPTAPSTLLILGLGPTMGFIWPSARLSRQIQARSEAILGDLPDTLDLLAISVEAGLGFEGAVGIVREHFQSPLADEFSLLLGEMQLGLSRREALENMRDRTDVPALSTFIQAMIQADALGMPVGRVLKTQATEMRSQRRQWAREKAAKLPVKILLPLVMFIFPPIMMIVMGPAVLSFRSL